MTKLDFNANSIFHKIKTCICVILIFKYLRLTQPSPFFEFNFK